MKLGFIGTGKITLSVVTGICNSNIKFKNIYLSPRNKNIAKKLEKKFKKVSILKSNQDVINSSGWVFLGITPNVGENILKNLKFKRKQTIISFISTITLPRLKKLIKENNQILQSFSKNYKDQFKIKNLGIFQRFNDIRIIGIGGSSLGTKTIYSFLRI